MRFAVTFIIIILFLSCSSKEMASTKGSKDSEQLFSWMTGTFSSAEQSKNDSTFFSINLVMTPIWLDNTEAKWLYVEQAVSSNLKQPYRQRVYKVNELTDGSFASEVYELPNDDRFIHGWENMSLFNAITPDSLKTREGCTVFLSRQNKNEFAGSTDTDKCKSSLYGASYATSKVQVFKNKIISWDQGWDDKDEQVWGAETGGYIFDRTK